MGHARSHDPQEKSEFFLSCSVWRVVPGTTELSVQVFVIRHSSMVTEIPNKLMKILHLILKT